MNSSLTYTYRELDRDLAQLYYRIQGWNNEVQTPFVADDAAMEELTQEWNTLKNRVEAIEAPDRVYALLKNHFTDFLSTLSFMLETNRKNPEAALLNYYYMMPKFAWLDDREDEVRCHDLEERYHKVAEDAEAYGQVICERYSTDELNRLIPSIDFAIQAANTEGDRAEENFPGWTPELQKRLKAAVQVYCDGMRRVRAIVDENITEANREDAKTEESEIAEDTVNTSPLDMKDDESATLSNLEVASSHNHPSDDSMHADDVSMTGHRFTSAQPTEHDKADTCETAMEDLSISMKMDPEDYRAVLRDRQGVDLDELLAWHQEEIEKTRSDCFRIAAALNLPDTDPTTMAGVNDIIFRYEPPCSSGEEMHRVCNAYLKRTRALAHEYVKLPEDEQAICVPIPKIYTASYAWGGYEGGDFSHAPYIGKMFLNQYNYQNITDGWIKLNALHESYPGHHCQFVRAAIDPTPETVKIGSRLIPILEGTCLRTESAFCDLFEEDPVFPLFIAYRRHHASVRIYVDLMMFYYGCTLEEAIQIYEKELAFDRVTARAQVQAHQSSPGYFTCYYYGMKKITQWEKEYHYNKKDFTELLFSAGYISMDSFHMLVQMTPEEQQRYFTEFKSLMRE